MRLLLPALGIVVLAAGASAAIAVGASRHAGAIDPRALPLGDGRYGSSPRSGWVDSCRTSFNGGGAQGAEPWIHGSTWDSAAKPSVRGAVSWPSAYFRQRVAGTRRVLSFDDLPTWHSTGTFPIAPSDPAYRYDRNPNRIAAHTVSWSLPLAPRPAASRSCLPGGPIGVLTDGVYLYDALDGGGRDAAAREVLDLCGGHPDMSSSYHHHSIPPCLRARARRGRSTLVGYALDGFGIYVTEDARGRLPTNTRLDACHGTTSAVPWNGRSRRVYHYVATLEFPYTIGCFRGTPLRTHLPGPPPPPPR